VAISVILRTALSIALGSAVLWNGGGALGLAFAVALAHAVSAIPCFFALREINVMDSSRNGRMQGIHGGRPIRTRAMNERKCALKSRPE